MGGNIHIDETAATSRVAGDPLTAPGVGGGFGGEVNDALSGGSGHGGTAQLTVGDGTITVNGSADLSANGQGGNGQTGGDGHGGYASINGDDGTIDLGTFTSVGARGTGGNASAGFGGNGGNGQGGYASIEARAFPITEGFSPAATITGGDAIVDASGTGGTGGAGYVDPENSENDIAAGSGGDGQGGGYCDCEFNGGAFVTAQVDGATIDLGNVTIVSDGIGRAGGAGLAVSRAALAAMVMGARSCSALNPYQSSETSGSIDFLGIEAHTQGVGGDGGASAGGTGGLGGDGQGGSTSMVVSVEASTGTTNFRASGFGGKGGKGTGGDGGDGGDAHAGASEITINSGGSLTAGDIGNFARAFAGDGGDSTTGVGGDGGDATGGRSFLAIAEGGLLTANSYFGAGHAPGGYELDENGDPEIDPETGLPVSLGGNGGIGFSGDGAGGNSQSGTGVGATIDGTAIIAGNFIISSYASGGNGSSGGNATAGTSSITVNGIAAAGGTVQASAQGQGGNGDQFGGGDGQGGSSTIQVNGTLDAGQINVLNRGFGGNGVTAGGDADGGDSTFIVNGGSATLRIRRPSTPPRAAKSPSSAPDGNADAGSVYVAKLQRRQPDGWRFGSSRVGRHRHRFSRDHDRQLRLQQRHDRGRQSVTWSPVRRSRSPHHRWRHHRCRQARALLRWQHCHGGCDRGTFGFRSGRLGHRRRYQRHGPGRWPRARRHRSGQHYGRTGCSGRRQ